MPCRMMSPTIEKVSDERPDIKVGKVNVDEEPELASKFGVMSIPTLVVLMNGQVRNQSVGVIPKEKIIDMI